MGDIIFQQQFAEFGQALLPDRTELGPVITDQLIRPTGGAEGGLAETGDPVTGLVVTGYGGQGIAGVVINQNRDINGRAIAEAGLFEVNMPLLIRSFFGNGYMLTDDTLRITLWQKN